MEIGIITDEISEDVEEAFEFGKELGINHFELRNVWGSRVPRIKDREIKKLKKLIKKHNVEITALSPGILKTSLKKEDLNYHKNELLEKTFSLAEELDVSNIIVFGIIEDESPNQKIIKRVINNLKEVVKKAAKSGFQILLENEAGCYAGTARETLEIVENIQQPALKINWDPGNAYRAGGNPFPGGYNLIKEYIGNVHVKDIQSDNGKLKWTTLDKGAIDWQGQLKALKQDNYQGILVIENHCQPLKESTRLNYEEIKGYLSRIFQKNSI